MGRFKNILLVSSAAFFLIPQLGCASQRHSFYLEAPQGQAYFNPSPNLEDPTLLSKWLGPVSERDKIDYLLGRVAASNNRFIRNGDIHDGKQARLWLLYKMSHWVEGVKTADDFVTRVASYSQKTGDLYLVKFPDGKIYSLRSVLRNELSLFEDRVVRVQRIGQTGISQPGPVSLSAAAAVAQATSKN